MLEGVSDTEPGWDELAGLHPSEDPGDGAEVGHRFFSGALGGAGAEAGVLEFGYGGGLLEVGEGVRVVDDVLFVEGKRGVGELIEGGFPGGEDFSGQVWGVAAWPLMLDFGVGAGEGVERGGDHEFEVALGEDDVGVLPIEDFALLGEAEFAGEGVDGLGEDGTVGGTAAASYGASATVEEAEVDAAITGDLVEGTVGFVDLPGAGDHAAVLVGVGVAEHDFLAVVPGLEEGLIDVAGPDLAHDGGRVLEVFNGFEEGDGLEAWVGVCRVVGGFDLDSSETGEAEDVEDVFGAGGSANNVEADGLGSVGVLEFRDGAEGFDDFSRLGRQSRRERVSVGFGGGG